MLQLLLNAGPGRVLGIDPAIKSEQNGKSPSVGFVLKALVSC